MLRRRTTPSFMIDGSYFIPGYSGFCPQLKYENIGGTFGRITNKVLTNPSWKSKRGILNEVKPELVPPGEIAIARQHLKQSPRNDRDPTIFEGNMTTGYSGAVPHSQHFQGQTFPISSLLATDSFNEQQKERKQSLRSVDLKVAVQDGSIAMLNVPACVETSPMALRYGAPISKTYAKAAPYVLHQRTLFSKSPYDMDGEDKNKFMKSGYTGHVPLIGEFCGHSNYELTNDAINEFRDGRPFYRPLPTDQRVTEYDIGKAPPASRSPRRTPKKTETKVKPKIFPVTLGLPITYKGHIQGLNGIVGMTYGNATLEIKQKRCQAQAERASKSNEDVTVTCHDIPYFQPLKKTN